MSRTYSNISGKQQKHSKVSSRQYLYLDNEPRDEMLFSNDEPGVELFNNVGLMKRDFRQRAHILRHMRS